MKLNIHSRVKLACQQFETAVKLFLTGGDRFSVITLAGAADVIFCQTLSRRGIQNLTQYIADTKKDSRPIGKIGREINDLLHINDLKHMDDQSDVYVDMNLEECALGAILKALANYHALDERNQIFVDGLKAWVKANLDPSIYNVNCDPNWNSKQN